MPKDCNSANPFSSSRTLTDSKEIPLSIRNSFVFKQLEQPGCQYTFTGWVIFSGDPASSKLLMSAPSIEGSNNDYSLKMS
jgi:hypothetical protein